MSMITPPSEDQTFTLSVPEPVQVVDADEVSEEGKFLPAVPEGRKLEINRQAQSFTTDLMSVNVNDPSFIERIRDISSLAEQEIVASTDGPNRLLDRSTSVASSKRRGANDPTLAVVSSLADLRTTVEDLTPNAADLSPARKILGFIPGGKKVVNYFQRYKSAESHLDAVIKSLMAGQDELRQDNAALQVERVKLYQIMGELNEYAILAEGIDKELVVKIEACKVAGDLETANKLETDVLNAIRQRRQDILTQLAVSIQGYLTMEIVQKNNDELIKGVNRTRTTTLTALRTAVMLAKALTNQELVLDQLDAVNATTNKAILQTSEMLKRNTGRIHEQAVNSGVSVETLTKAFDNIFSTMDEIENFKVKANATMEQNINSLGAQLERTRPRLEQAKRLELGN